MAESESKAGRRGRSIRFRITALAVFLVFATALAVTTWVFRSFEAQLVEQTLGELDSETHLQGLRFLARIQEVRQDVSFLSGTPPIEGIVRAKEAGGTDPLDGSTEAMWKSRLQTIFSQMAQAKPHYVQIRYIGLSDGGRELVRVDRRGLGGAIRVVAEDELQKKGDQSYFTDAIRGPAGQVSLSNIDLNKEGSVITTPRCPVLRASIPVYSGHRLIGVVVINQSIEDIFREISSSADGHHIYYLTNAKGDYLYHPDENKTFAFEFNRVSRFPADYPSFASQFEEGGETSNTEVIERDGETRLVSVRLVNYDPFHPGQMLGIVLSENLHEVTQASRMVKRRAYLIIFGMVLVGVTAGAIKARRISEPFQKISQVVEDFDGERRGDLPVHDSGEAGQLAQAFDKMLGKIELQRSNLKVEAQERHRAEQEVRAVLNSAPDAVVTIDSDGTLLSFNPRAEKIFGWSAQDAVGQNVKILMPEQTAQRHDHYLDNYRRGKPSGAGSLVRELFASRKDGSQFPIELTIGPVDVFGETHFVGIIRDVSERKEAEKQLRELNESLARSNAELEQFAHVASHDLQAPLRAIMSFSQLLELEHAHELSVQGREFLDHISESAVRMRSLIRDLLALSKVGSLDRTPTMVDLEGVMSEVLDNLSVAIRESGAQIKYQSLPTVMGHYSLLVQLFQNLVQNSIVYGPEDGVPRITLEARPTEAGYELEVADNGRGIAPEHQERVLQMFQRLDPRANPEGTGIGLPLCKKIAERHGGRLRLESTLGLGTKFFIELPAPKPEGGSADTPSQSENAGVF
ncbi:MAG TPA: PAS domain S-box protein [Phycisphaerales bacterium]|nr:PAS domain S-box protein [Phycisphaerales bacterium]